MFTTEQPHSPSHSLFRRPSLLWRRFSKRERPGQNRREAQQSGPNQQHQSKLLPQDLPRRRLTKRATEPPPMPPNKLIITHIHMQAFETASKRSEPEILSPTRVTASDMRTTPFPHSPRVYTVGWNVFLSPEQVFSLVMGFAPRQMEDKWFIYSEGPDTSGKLKVHFHRSWTGLKIAELFVLIDLKGEGAGKIVGVKWNGTEQTNGMDEEEAKYMISTTCAWVLGAEIETGMI
ncbi:hypothetical protein P154DRAFT_256799 [Amniculicola lignicola CBS 123094]|uniref:Uncharacterized protein n=1 Tax=Amniculicola lignicola CBS 123094 TaxID=1392246 RepID=A0A6A5WZ94_9PLEO|nr:hypothetical protein P154DRAFT_256799 [Amniculicola lignicola CBS 123094]